MASMPFTQIIRHGDAKHLVVAREFVANTLHVNISDVSFMVAVSYIDKHFRTVGYEGWEGYVEMLETDEAAAQRVRGAGR